MAIERILRGMVGNMRLQAADMREQSNEELTQAANRALDPNTQTDEIRALLEHGVTLRYQADPLEESGQKLQEAIPDILQYLKETYGIEDISPEEAAKFFAEFYPAESVAQQTEAEVALPPAKREQELRTIEEEGERDNLTKRHEEALRIRYFLFEMQEEEESMSFEDALGRFFPQDVNQDGGVEKVKARINARLNIARKSITAYLENPELAGSQFPLTDEQLALVGDDRFKQILADAGEVYRGMTVTELFSGVAPRSREFAKKKTK